jgi:hypothetical protein
MPITAQYAPISSPSAGDSAPIPVTWPFAAPTDLVVYERTTATGVETEETYGVDYTVTWTPNGGTVTPLRVRPVGTSWIVERSTDLTQPSSLRNGGPYNPETVENVLNRSTLQIQELREEVPTFPETRNRSPGAPLAFDANGNVTNGSPIGSGDLTLRSDLAGATGGANVSVTATGAGAVARDLLSKSRDVINVLDFIPTALHADIRANTTATDVTTYVQAALTAATGRRLVFNAGTYIVTGVTGSNDIDIVGDGKGQAILIRKTNTVGNESVLTFTSKSGFSISGLTINGNKASQVNASQACTIDACSDFTIEDCDFINAKLVSGFGIGLAVVNCNTANRMAKINGCTITGNDAQGLLIKNSLGLSVTGNLVTGNGLDGISLADYTFPPPANAQTQVIISGNHCHANGNSGITAAGYFTGGVLGAPIYGPNGASSFILIEGNICGTNTYYGIAWQGAYGAVEGNTCYSNGGLGFGSGILFNGLAASCDGNSVYNNEIWGIDAGGSYHSTVSDNACFANGEVGINMGASVDCICSGNQVVVVGSDADGGITMAGIDGDGTTPFPTVGSGTVISGNKIVLNGNAGTRGITVTRDYRNAVVKDNTVSGATAANQAYIFEVDRITSSGNVDAYLFDVAGQQLAGVASAAPMIIPDHIEVATVSGTTNITDIRTYSQNVYAGKVRDVRISAQGTGYSPSSLPTIGFSGGGGTGAAATAEVDNGGRVVGVIMTNNGSGYTSAPTVSITGGGGSGAAGTALVGCNNANGRKLQFLFQGALTVNDGGNLALAGNLTTTANGATLSLLGAYGSYYETGRTSGI